MFASKKNQAESGDAFTGLFLKIGYILPEILPQCNPSPPNFWSICQNPFEKGSRHLPKHAAKSYTITRLN
jgi:hypothetical protein